MRIICKLLLAASVFVALLPGQFVPPGRKNFKITITAGTPQRVSATPLVVDRYIIQMAIGGTGSGLICIVPVATTPAASCATAGQLSGQLAPASATAPGGSWSDGVSNSGGSINLQTVWVDGSNSGDVVIVSANVK